MNELISELVGYGIEKGLVEEDDKIYETNSRIAEVGESYQSFNVMTKELRATEVLQMEFCI